MKRMKTTQVVSAPSYDPQKEKAETMSTSADTKKQSAKTDTEGKASHLRAIK